MTVCSIIVCMIETAFIWILHLVGFTIAYQKQTDAITDFSYALGFVGSIWISYYLVPFDVLNLIVAVAVTLWAFRLGGYLAFRVKLVGKDARFDEVRTSFLKFGSFWFFQAATICIMILPFKLVFADTAKTPVIWVSWWSLIYLVGFLIEAVSDWQKFQFKRRYPTSFCSVGLWKICRHPNYLGEIICWWSLALLVSYKCSGWGHIIWISPMWITFLLIKVSGIPPLEKAWTSKYSGDSDYQEYLRQTDRLSPLKWFLGVKK